MTRHAILEDLARRRTQVRRYIAVVQKTEREMRLGSGRKLEADRLHVLRAGTFLILYNLVEASARAAIQAIHDDMAAGRVPFGDLNVGIRREVVKGFKRKGDANVHHMMTDLPVDLVSASLDVDYHFSGNVDAKLIREIAERYSFSADTDKKKTRDGVDLLTVKSHRNDLAHGDKTFDEVGRSFTGRDLLEIAIRTVTYVEGILNNVVDYLEAEGYRAAPPPP